MRRSLRGNWLVTMFSDRARLGKSQHITNHAPSIWEKTALTCETLKKVNRTIPVESTRYFPARKKNVEPPVPVYQSLHSWP
jgi:hypothetical protein